MDDDRDNDATEPKLISSYTRSEALADGVLVDVTETAREAGFVIPVALTVDGRQFPGMFDHGDPGEVDQEISGGK